MTRCAQQSVKFKLYEGIIIAITECNEDRSDLINMRQEIHPTMNYHAGATASRILVQSVALNSRGRNSTGRGTMTRCAQQSDPFKLDMKV